MPDSEPVDGSSKFLEVYNKIEYSLTIVQGLLDFVYDAQELHKSLIQEPKADLIHEPVID